LHGYPSFVSRVENALQELLAAQDLGCDKRMGNGLGSTKMGMRASYSSGATEVSAHHISPTSPSYSDSPVFGVTSKVLQTAGGGREWLEKANSLQADYSSTLQDMSQCTPSTLTSYSALFDSINITSEVLQAVDKAGAEYYGKKGEETCLSHIP
jgi:hypothetical protein